MARITPFCPACEAFFPAGATCPGCGQARPPVATPAPAGQPLWRANLPGAAALRPALAHVDGRALLLLPWGDRERGASGVVALDVADGSQAWATPLDIPVEGGVAVAEAAGVAVVGLARREGLPPGEGALVALDLRTGRLRWPARVRLGGAVEAAPVTDGVRLYAAANDGRLYCADLLSGRLIWPPQPVAGRPVRIPAPPALYIERGLAQAIVVGTCEVTPWREDGAVVAFDREGHRLWPTPADPGGQVRGAPVIAGNAVYVAAYRGSPPAGVLSAFDLRRGRPLWPRPFTVPAPPGGRGDIVAAPLVVGGTIYVGSHDHHLYAVDAATGVGPPLCRVPRGIACPAAWVEGLVIFGANDGVLYAVDAATGEIAWQVALGGRIHAMPLVADGTIFAASDNGAVVALPWHGGRYQWAAARLEAQGRWDEAGDCHALAAHFQPNLAAQEEGYRRAAAAWEKANRPEKAGRMWLGLGARWRRPAADAFRRAGLAHCGRDRHRAAACLKQAADLYYELYLAQPLPQDADELVAALNESTQALAECAGLPYLAVRMDNLDSLVQWEESRLALRLTNTGAADVKGEVRVAIGGGFAELVEARLLGDLRARGQWRFPVTAVAVRPRSLLEIEVEYDSGHPDYGPLRTILLQPTTAAARPRPPVYTYNIGDVGVLKLSAGRADDGSPVQVVTGDVGLISARGGQIGSVTVRGDVAALVGVDPSVRQEVADLAAAVGWLGERLARLELAAPGPTPATMEDLAGLRQSLDAQRASLEALLARLAADQREAVSSLAADLRQLGEKLDALGKAQAEARRLAAPVTPPPVVDPRTARWSRRPDEFAARIEVGDLPGFLGRGLVVEPGVCALFLEEGRAQLGQVGPGHYTVDALLDRVPGMRGIRRVTAIVAEAGEISLPFELPDLLSADGRRVAVRAELCFRLADTLAFFVNFMQGRERVARDELRDHLLPEVRDAAQEWVAGRRSADLTGALVQKDALAAAVEAHLRGTLDALGLRFERVRALAFH